MSESEYNNELDAEEVESVFSVTDEDGIEREMIMVYTFESEGNAYAVLLERENPEADGVILRIEEEDGDAVLVGIDDDAEWERVVEIYNREVAEA